MNDADLERIHKHCGWHEPAVRVSGGVGCFYCLAVFPTADVVEWVDEDPQSPNGSGRTALCPKCGNDSVLPDSLWFALTPELLLKMKTRFF